MPASVVANSCRLTVMTSRTRVDLAVPVDVPVADLVAGIVAGLGPQIADEGITSGGWVLQRLGEKPLDPARTLSMLGVTDGAVLRLVPRSQQLPEVAYDDVLDAVGTGVREGTTRWTATHGRRMLLTLGGIALTWALLLTVLSGPSWLLPSVILGVATVLLLGGAAALTRTVSTPGPAVLTGAAAVVFATATGACVLGDGPIYTAGAVQLLPAAGGAVLAAVICLLVVRRGVALFVAVLAAGILAVIGTGVATVFDVSVLGSAALTATVALAFSPFLPVLSFRLSRLGLPAIPTGAEDLRTDTSTVDGTQVLGQAARADEYLTGLMGAVAAVVSLCAVLLVTEDNTSARVLAGILGAILLLRARLFTGLGQRASLLAGGSLAALALLVATATGVDGTMRELAFVVPLLVVAALLVAGADLLPGRRLAPTWGRTADIVEALFVLAVIPLALGVLGVYGLVQDLTAK